jgi:uncharacterized membrane protein
MPSSPLPIVAALGVALIAGSEAFGVLAGLDLAVTSAGSTVFLGGLAVALALALATAGWSFHQVLRREKALAAAPPTAP